jgi:hypothetical protein
MTDLPFSWRSDRNPHLTTDHSQSSYGVPVLYCPWANIALGPADNVPVYGGTAAEFVAGNTLANSPLGQEFLRAAEQMGIELPSVF